jgi:hypothetical protein
VGKCIQQKFEELQLKMRSPTAKSLASAFFATVANPNVPKPAGKRRFPLPSRQHLVSSPSEAANAKRNSQNAPKMYESRAETLPASPTFISTSPKAIANGIEGESSPEHVPQFFPTNNTSPKVRIDANLPQTASTGLQTEIEGNRFIFGTDNLLLHTTNPSRASDSCVAGKNSPKTTEYHPNTLPSRFNRTTPPSLTGNLPSNISNSTNTHPDGNSCRVAAETLSKFTNPKSARIRTSPDPMTALVTTGNTTNTLNEVNGPTFASSEANGHGFGSQIDNTSGSPSQNGSGITTDRSQLFAKIPHFTYPSDQPDSRVGIRTQTPLVDNVCVANCTENNLNKLPISHYFPPIIQDDRPLTTHIQRSESEPSISNWASTSWNAEISVQQEDPEANQIFKPNGLLPTRPPRPPVANVFFASVAGPIAPQPIHFSLPPRLGNFTHTFPQAIEPPYPRELVTDPEDLVPKEEDEDIDLDSLDILKHPSEIKSRMSQIPDSLSGELILESKGGSTPESLLEIQPPTYVLAYGPYPIATPRSDPDEQFEYRMYLHYTHLPDNAHFYIAYGNPPYYPIENICLRSTLSREYISGLCENWVRLIVMATHFLRSGQTQLNHSVLLQEHYLEDGFWAPESRTYGHEVYRYPLVEIILSMATFFLHLPHGEYADAFRLYHPQAARIIFDSPSISPSLSDSDGSIDLFSTSSMSSYECEEVSRQSMSPLDEDGTQGFGNPGANSFATPMDEDDELDIYATDEEIPNAPALPTIELPAESISPPPLQLRHPFSPPTPMPTPDFAAYVCDIIHPSSKIRSTISNSPDQSLPSAQTEEHQVISTEGYKVNGHLVGTLEGPPTRPFGADYSQDTQQPSDGWNNTWAWDHPSHFYNGKPIEGEDIIEPYQPPVGDEVGILAYGPFPNPHSICSLEYRIYIHEANKYDVLEYFAYGGPQFLNGEEARLFKLPISPFVLDSSLDHIREYRDIIHSFDAYLRGDPRFKDGVTLPDEYLVNPFPISSAISNRIHFRFPLVEKLLSTLAARIYHPRLIHPYGQFSLRDIRNLVSPNLPVLLHPEYSVVQLRTPDLPYIQVKFPTQERRHIEDTDPELQAKYFGCLSRHDAFLFQKHLISYVPQLYQQAKATTHLLVLHADPTTQPPTGPRDTIDWEKALEPYSFADYFQSQEPFLVAFKACPRGSWHNYWFPRLQYILQCVRQVNQLIRSFETFFIHLGYDGFRDLVDQYSLNREVDFVHNPILSAEQAQYFTALYDFLLREHALYLAEPILQLLHISFPEPNQLNLLFRHIVNIIEPPLYSYVLYNDDDDISSSSA